MTKKEKFNVTVAAFEALLEKNKLWSKYMANFRRSNKINNSGIIYISWKEWASKTHPHKWLASAFIWEETPENVYPWRELDYAWLIWICENLDN